MATLLIKNRSKRGWWLSAVLAVFLLCLTTLCVYINLKLGGRVVARTHARIRSSKDLGKLSPHQWRTPVKKSPFLNQTTPLGGAFVHVGKTGGSTLSVLLRNGCHSWLKHPCRNVTTPAETVASHKISAYYHVADFGLLPKSHHDFYVVTLRNPYDRVISAFCYEHLSNMKARNETPNLHPAKLALMQQGYDTGRLCDASGR
jgi:hypothetical protein